MPLWWLLFVVSFACLLHTRLGSSPGGCGTDGWLHWPGTRKCFKLFSALTLWNKAEMNCRAQGGTQISVQDLHENQFLGELAKQANAPVWLGAVQFGTSRNYVWVDGTPFAFEYWQNNVRPAYNPKRTCTKLNGRTGEWLQSCCRNESSSICQKSATQLYGNGVDFRH